MLKEPPKPEISSVVISTPLHARLKALANSKGMKLRALVEFKLSELVEAAK